MARTDSTGPAESDGARGDVLMGVMKSNTMRGYIVELRYGGGVTSETPSWGAG